MREELAEFAMFQEKALKANDHKSGWYDMSYSSILKSIKGEVEELEEELVNMDIAKAKCELADIANYCMFMFNKLNDEDE